MGTEGLMIRPIQNNFVQNTGSKKQNLQSDLECPKAPVAQATKDELTKETLAVLSPIVPFRRMSALPDEINNGNYAKATGLAALMALNIPEDTRDLKAAANQLLKKPLPIELSKDFYKNYQTPFSFFRGTFLEPIVNKMGKLGVKLHEWDKPLESTKFGEYLANKFNFEITDFSETGRVVNRISPDPNNIGKTYIDKVAVDAFKVEGKPFGKLLGNALLRIPRLSVFVLGALEIPAIYKAFSKPDNTKDKLIDGSAQIVKSGINTSTMLAGIGVFGALLKGKGAVGSLVGMGIGSVAGAYASKQIGNRIDSVSNKIKEFI